MCVGVTQRVCVKLCVSVCVEDVVCSTGLGTFCIQPPGLCLSVCECVNIIVRVVL